VARRGGDAAYARAGQPARLRGRALHDALELGDRVLRLAAADLHDVRDELLGIVARHPPAAHRLVDDLLQAVAADDDPAREQVAQHRERRVQRIVGGLGRGTRRRLLRSRARRRTVSRRRAPGGLGRRRLARRLAGCGPARRRLAS
jgi:hypothetical protein